MLLPIHSRQSKTIVIWTFVHATFVIAAFVHAAFVMAAFVLATFVNINNISDVTDPILIKFKGSSWDHP